jgi:TnpA family transposase
MKRQKSNLENKTYDKRLKVLSKNQYKEYYLIPVLSDEEREEVFLFNEDELIEINQLKSYNSKISLMLQMGYFKLKIRFFNMNISNPLIKSDINYLINKYYRNKLKISDFSFSETTLVRQRKNILKFYDYKDNTENIIDIKSKVEKIVTIDTTPFYIFKEIWKYCFLKKYILPSYKDIQLIISKEVNNEEKRILSLMESLLTNDIIKSLDTLTEKNNEGRIKYLVSFLRSPNKELSHTEIYKETKKCKTLKPIYKQSLDIFQKMNISNNTIKYFSSYLERQDIYNLIKRNKYKRYFILLCFVHYKYLITTDNLVYSFLSILDKKLKEIDIKVKDIIKNENINNYNNSKKISNLLTLFIQENNPDKTNDFLKKAFEILDKQKIKSLIDYIDKNFKNKFDIEWAELDKHYETIKRNLREIFQNLDFTQTSSGNFIESVSFLKEHFLFKNKDFTQTPIDFIPKKQKKYIWQPKNITVRKEINPKRYEIFLYKILKEKIKAEDIILKDSLSYKNLEDYLINEKYFNENFDSIINSLSLDRIHNFNKYLEYNIEIVDSLFKRVNDINYDEVSSIPENIIIKKTNNEVFSDFPIINLIDLMRIVNEDTGFLSEFESNTPRYNKSQINIKTILAVLIAYGTNFGIKKMSTSSGFSISTLRSTSEIFFDEMNLKKANQIINDKASKLKTFEYFNISENTIHSSSDGQRFPVSGKIFKARYSRKHFAKGKTLSVISNHANYQPLELKVIAPNEYEGYYTLELLLMNESNIKPTIHSTDTHGITAVNFLVMALSGYDFAPRIANIKETFSKFVGASNLNLYPKEWKIKPSKKIDKQLILSEKNNIIRVIASLNLKTGSVSTIIKKLSNSKKRHNRLIKAMCEFDKLLKTIHILKYIDSDNYRKEIHTALNRGEEYHNMSRHVNFGSLGKIKAKSEEKQNIYQQCNRLICNSIIYYNCYVLSRIIEEKEKQGNFEFINKLKKISPISWEHVNLFGKYDFDDISFKKVDFENELKKKVLDYEWLNIDE